MNSSLRILFIVVLLGLLVVLRMFAADWFYDPLEAFFKGQYQGQPLPEIAAAKLLAVMALRFWITAAITVGVIHLWFDNRSKTRLSLLVLAVAFVLFFIAFWVLIVLKQPPLEGLFYIRRFLIQPLILILLIPAFYYEMSNSNAAG